VAVSISLLLSVLLGAEPAATPKTATSKVYVVYVTVVEIDAEGKETIVFTPKVQTTGAPAGITVDHADGRSFEFNCKLAAADGPSLERPGTGAAVSSAKTKTARPALKQKLQSSVPETLTPASGSRPGPELVRPEKTAPPATAAAPRKADEIYVRNYDVSDLIEAADPVTDADFTPLIQTLKTVAVPEQWTGKAAIRPFTSTKSLVIKQNDAGHKAVAQALKELRPKTIEKTEKSLE
jgi:hypothetical protein